jgi:hypothetical protein
VPITKYYSGDQIKKNDLHRADKKHVGRKGNLLKGLLWRNLMEGHYLKDPGVDGRTILKSIFETWYEGVDYRSV